MKKTFSIILTILFISSVFVSCKKDENKDEKSIAGTWNAISTIQKNCDDPSENIEQNLSELKCDDTSTYYCIELIYIFNDDGTTTLNANSSFFGLPNNISTSGTYSVTGNEVEVCFSGLCSIGTFTDTTMTIESVDDAATGCDSTTTFEKS